MNYDLSGHVIPVEDVASWVSWCGRLAPVASTVVFAAPIPTFMDIKRKKTVGDLPLLPYSAMLVNCCIWAAYGRLKGELEVWWTYVVGSLFALYYCTEFRHYCPPKACNLPGTFHQHFMFALIVLTMVVLCTVFFVGDEMTQAVGSLGVCSSFVMFGAPLSKLPDVVARADASTIQLPFTLACLCHSFLWAVFGLLEINDFTIAFPSLCGFCLSTVQLSLVLLYNNNNHDHHHHNINNNNKATSLLSKDDDVDLDEETQGLTLTK